MVSASVTGDLMALAGQASTEALTVATEVLRDDIENQRWRAQLGPCLTQGAVATLLKITPQAVAKRAAGGDLVRLTNVDGRPAYPLFQFVGRDVVAGLSQVVALLGEVDDALTIASWLTIPKPALDGRTPADGLRDGAVDEVVAAAADYVARST